MTRAAFNLKKEPAFLASMGYVEASAQPSTQSHNQGGRS